MEGERGGHTIQASTIRASTISVALMAGSRDRGGWGDPWHVDGGSRRAVGGAASDRRLWWIDDDGGAQRGGGGAEGLAEPCTQIICGRLQ
jgi:hypothetical protein